MNNSMFPIKDNNIKFSEQFPIIKTTEQLIVLETTTLNLKTKKLDRAIRLAHRSFRIKKHLPGIKTICFIRTNLDPDHKALHTLMEAFDRIIIK